MVETVVTGGIVATFDEERTVYDPGAVAIDDTEIVAVGGTTIADEYDTDRVVDASGCLVVPGLINTHVHVPDILYRGLGRDRRLHDWLFNIKRPLVGAMSTDDHRIGAELYTRESLAHGVTTFVENAGGTGSGYDQQVVETKLDVYDRLGVRNVYAHCFLDKPSGDEFADYVELQEQKEPTVDHIDDPLVETQKGLDTVESYIKQYHGTADGRQSVWPGPFLAGGTTPECLAGAYQLAEEYDVMTTTHTAETTQQERGLGSSVEYLDSADYLGPRTLLGHCVHVSEEDIQLLAATDTKVAHNVATNCALASGIAPVPSMHRHGVTVGLGTDNVDQNHTADLLSDVRLAALLHKTTGTPRTLPAERAIEMATIDAARAIGRGDDLGSLEAGKLADIVLLDIDSPSMLPYTDAASALVYQAHAADVDTVLCNGSVVVEDGQLTADSDTPDRADVLDRRSDLIDRAGLSHVDTGHW